MLIFESVFSPERKVFAPIDCPQEKLLYFDIETTGFSPDTSSLYLIGCLYYRGENWHTIQWFADDYVSEKALLTSFFTFMEDFDVLVHYNGTGFDIPYLQKKCVQHKLSFGFDKIKSLDIYKQLTPYKKLLSLPNLKQKTIEASLGLFREDKYDGGQLIKVYVEYIHRKLKKQEGLEECLTLLLLHNKEDLQGLFSSSALLLPPEISPEKEAVDTSDCVSFKLSFPYTLSKPLFFNKGAVTLSIEGNQGFLTLHFFTGELKYFYPDYKDYYYLPHEDTAIHKSVAEYVDKEYREKAKASNCYTKKSGRFLPLPKGFSVPEGIHLFQTEYKSKELWIDAEESRVFSAKPLLSYLSAILLE